MWRLKLKLSSEKQFMGRMAIKHKVSVTGYPLSYWKDKKYIYLISAGFIFGEESNKQSLIKDLKKQPEYVESEQSGDFIILTTNAPSGRLLVSESCFVIKEYLTPKNGLSNVLPRVLNSSTSPAATFEGIANPIFCPPSETAVLTPMTSPFESINGPPELPGLIAASV